MDTRRKALRCHNALAFYLLLQYFTSSWPDANVVMDATITLLQRVWQIHDLPSLHQVGIHYCPTKGSGGCILHFGY